MRLLCKRLLLLVSLTGFLYAGYDDLNTPQMEIGTNFWDIGWAKASNTPFKSPFDEFVPVENPWREDFLGEIKIYTCFRFMDWNKTNSVENEWERGLNYHRSWETRTKKNDRVQKPLAYEWMIDLCNRTGANMWITVPHVVDDAYVAELAKLIKELLRPVLKCYVEWSNETWNGSFTQGMEDSKMILSVMNKGKKLPAAILDAYPMKANRYYVGQLYHAIRTLEVHKVFVDVFAGQRSRLVLVMGGAMQHAFHSKSHIYAINNSACNPHGIKPDAYAIAPYVGITANPGSSTLFADLLGEQLKDRIATVKEKSIDVGQTSMKLIAYEGGQHLTHSDSRSVAPQKDPRMGALYKVMLDSLANYLTHFNHYVHMGGTWGAKANIGDPDNISPKYVQLREWSKKYHPTSSIIPHRLTPVGTSAMVYKNKNGTVMYTLLGKRVSAVNPTTAFQPFVKNLHLGIQNRVELWVE